MKISYIKVLSLAGLTLAISSCTQNQIGMQTPEAKKIPEKLEIHGDIRTDNYFWMRLSDEQKEAETPDSQTQNVLDYLNAENAYLKEVMKPT